MNEVDFCCVIKPASKPSPAPPKAKPVKCNSCASLKRKLAQCSKDCASLTSTAWGQARVFRAIARECDLFLNNLDGIQPPYCNTPEEVEKEVRQRCINHMITIRKMLA